MKKSTDQPKLLMTCAAKYLLTDPKRRRNNGLHGGEFMFPLGLRSFGPDQRWARATLLSTSVRRIGSLPIPNPTLLASDLLSELSPSPRGRKSDSSRICPAYMRLLVGLNHAVHIIMPINANFVGRALVDAVSRCRCRHHSTLTVIHRYYCRTGPGGIV